MHIRSRRRSYFAAVLGVAAALIAAQAGAQSPHPDFPNRPMRIIVAVPAGGGVDLSLAIMAVGPNVLAVKHDSPAHTVADLIALAKANPGKMSYASQGNGSTTHLTMELFLSRTGVKLVHVPYRGAAPAANDLAGGHVDTMFWDLGTILPLHQGGRVRIIAVATLARLSQIPEVPTIDESGVAGFSSTTFYALMAPPKTPSAMREKLNKAIVTAMQSPEAETRLKTIFVGASPLGVHETGDFIKAQAKLWGDVIRAARITIEQ